MDARDWEQEVENVIEQSALGETQRANSVYRDLHDKEEKNQAADYTDYADWQISV
jgi:hypothetical protein